MLEQELLEKARKFDRQTLAEIYDRYNPELYRYAARLLGDPLLAEDCVAETFRRFLHAIQRGGGPEKYLRAYLYQIAHYWINDYYRRNHPGETQLENAAHLPAELSTAEEAAREMQAENLRQALRVLTPEQRQVVTLRFLEGWSQAEVAEALEKPVGAVKALQHRGLSALRRILNLQEVE